MESDYDHNVVDAEEDYHDYSPSPEPKVISHDDASAAVDENYKTKYR